MVNFKKLLKPKKFDNDEGLIDIVYIAVYLGIAVVAGAITLFIANQVSSATGTISSATTAGFHLLNASNNLYGTADTGYAFLPIVAVAAIGAVAIGYVFGLIPGIKKGPGGGGGI